MPPRPRPRFHLNPIPPQTDATNSSAPVERSKREEEEEEDALFMRNRGRSIKEVNKRAARAAATVLQSSSPTGSDFEEEDNEGTPKLGKECKQNTLNKTNALPKWAKKGGIRNLLCDSDSDPENNHPTTYEGLLTKHRQGGAAGNTNTPKGKRRQRTRSRSRSRSLTPPPDLTAEQKLHAQQAIKNALRAENLLRVSAPVAASLDQEEEDDVGGAELDPALQHIEQAVLAARRKEKGVLGSTQTLYSKMPQYDSNGKPREVNVRVKWIPQPEEGKMRAGPQQTWSFIVERDHSLKELSMEISSKVHIVAEDLVLTRDGKRVFTSVSPDGLGAWDSIDLEVCKRETFETFRAQQFRSPTPAPELTEPLEFDRALSAAPSEASADHEDEEKKFKLVLRAQGAKEVTLTVRPTTSCGKIVRAFLAVNAKHGGTVPTSPRKVAQVRLCIDGEKQSSDALIGDCDLEDGDMVEVVGL